MKTIAASEVGTNLEKILGTAQQQRVVLTRGGKPSAILVGIESYDAEDLQLVHSEKFWQMIESRRQGRSIPLSEVKARLKSRAPTRKGGSEQRPTKARRQQ